MRFLFPAAFAASILAGCAAVDLHRLGTGDAPNSDIRVAFNHGDWERASDSKLNYECKKDACGVGSQLIVWLGKPEKGERERFVSGEFNEAYIDGLADRTAAKQKLKKVYVKRIVQSDHAGYEMMMQTSSFAASHKYMFTRGAYTDSNFISVSSRASSEDLARRNMDTFFASVSFIK